MAYADKNIYEWIVENNGPGFWIRRTTWSGTIAQVITPETLHGKPPYYGSPKVTMDLYRPDGTLYARGVRNDTAGTYKTWRRIEPPPWATKRS
jgi:hypothetical protein